MQARTNRPPRKIVFGSLGSGMSSGSPATGSKVFFAETDAMVLPRVMSPSVSVTATKSLRVSSATRRSSRDFSDFSFRAPIPRCEPTIRNGVTLSSVASRAITSPAYAYAYAQMANGYGHHPRLSGCGFHVARWSAARQKRSRPAHRLIGCRRGRAPCRNRLRCWPTPPASTTWSRQVPPPRPRSR